jgi:hypothetical protein
MADLQFTVDYKQLKEANREISKVGSNAQKSASVFEAAFKKAEAQSVKSARAVREQITFSQRMERQKAREANATAAAAAAERKSVEQNTVALNRLRSTYNANFAVEQRTLELKKRLRQEIANGNMTVRQAGAELLKYRAHMQQFNIAQMAATKSSNRMGVVTQQAGYQIGDFLVQVQSGTNFMVAFGQQATQLVGILPLLAPSGGTFLGLSAKGLIGLSAGLGIAIPLVTALGAAFMRSGKEAKESVDDVDTLTDSIKSLDESLRDYLQTKKAAELGVTVEELLGAQNIEQATDSLRVAREEVEKLARARAAAAFGAGLGGGGMFLNMLVGDGVGELEAALLAVTNAENTLATLRQKQAEERRGNYNEEVREFRQRAALLEAQVKYGEDSVQVLRLEAEQRKANYGLQVSSMNLTESQMLALIRLNNEYEDSVTSQQELTRNQEVLKEGGQAFLNIWNAITGRITESVAQIKDAVTALDQMKIEFSFRGRSMGQYGGRSTVSNRPISGDVPEDAEVTSGGATSIKDPLPELMKRLALDERLLGVSEERAAVERAIADSDVTYSQASIDAAVKRLEAYNLEKQALEEIAATQEKIASILESSMENAFMSMVDGTKSVKDAFKSMAAEIIKELYRILVVKRITGMIAGTIGDASSMAGGNFFSGIAGKPVAQAMGGAWMKGVQMFANGGVVDSPTMFGHSGGVGVMGEAGPEAIMPLKRGANGKLGVSVEGGSGSVVVNNNINVTGGSDPAAIRMEVAKLMPQITSATKSAVIDARRRGGQMRAAFN